MPATLEKNHIYFEPMQVLFDTLDTNITDINAVRAARPTATGRQWIFPTEPEANDEDYPRIALIAEDVRWEEYGPRRLIEQVRGVGNVLEKERFGKVAVLPITIIVFVKRKQRHEVTLYDGSTKTIQNTKQADFLGSLISKVLMERRELDFIPLQMDIDVLASSRTYVNNEWSWGKQVDIEITMFDVWEIDYTGGPSTPISTIDLDFTTNRTNE